MPRPLRIEYEGARYHLLSRGDRCEDIVFDDADRKRFVETLGEAAAQTLFDEQSLSPRDRDAAADAGQGNAMDAGNLYCAIQRPPQAARASFLGTLQVHHGR